MNTYKIYLPSYTHEDLEIGTITHNKAANMAVLTLHGQKRGTFYSPYAAMAEVQKKHPNAYMIED